MSGDFQSAAGRNFSATRWSIVLAAKTPGDAQEALATLCRTYWYPLYAFVRRQGITPHDAEDLTQGFFEHLLGKGALAHVDRTRGRFRSFLLAALKNFLADARDRAQTLKRGGGKSIISLDACAAAERYAMEPHDTLSPDRLFDRRWALTVIDQALERLRAEYVASGRGRVFENLRPLLTAREATPTYAEIGRVLGMRESTVKVAAHRLRQRYRHALRAEIADTIQDPAELDAELLHLLDALGP